MRSRFSFNQFLDKKSRESRRHLGIVRDLLKHGGLHVEDFSHSESEPYLFVRNLAPDSGFGGVRVYQVGETIAFRVQREPDTQPYGAAYSLKIPDMFAELVEDHDEKEAGKQVMKGVIAEIRRFFVLSARAEQDQVTDGVFSSGLGGSAGIIVTSPSGGDWANTATSGL